MAARVRYLLQIIFALLISALGFFQLSERMNGKPTSGSVVMQIVCAIMFLVAWGLMSRFQKFGNQSIFACVLMLTSIGILMISRIDGEMDTAVAIRQMMWLCLALVCCYALFAFMKDYRILRRFSYVSMVIGLALLLSPMIPVRSAARASGLASAPTSCSRASSRSCSSRSSSPRICSTTATSSPSAAGRC